MNDITSDIVKTKLNITPDPVIKANAVISSLSNSDISELNGLANVTIFINNPVVNDSVGRITITAEISKIGLISPTGSSFTITWNNYQTKTQYDQDQLLMNGILTNMIKIEINISNSLKTRLAKCW